MSQSYMLSFLTGYLSLSLYKLFLVCEMQECSIWPVHRAKRIIRPKFAIKVCSGCRKYAETMFKPHVTGPILGQISKKNLRTRIIMQFVSTFGKLLQTHFPPDRQNPQSATY